MAAPVVGRGAGGVQVVLSPPLEFILRQSGSFRHHLEDLNPLWDRFEDIMGHIESDQFDSQGHGAWPGLAASTLAEKARRGYPLDPLIATGNLKDSLTNPSRASEKEAKSMTWGSDVEYAQYHQAGTPRMPQRQVIPDPFRVEDRRKLESAMVGWINDVARETWGRI